MEYKIIIKGEKEDQKLLQYDENREDKEDKEDKQVCINYNISNNTNIVLKILSNTRSK